MKNLSSDIYSFYEYFDEYFQFNRNDTILDLKDLMQIISKDYDLVKQEKFKNCVNNLEMLHQIFSSNKKSIQPNIYPKDNTDFEPSENKETTKKLLDLFKLVAGILLKNHSIEVEILKEKLRSSEEINLISGKHIESLTSKLNKKLLVYYKPISEETQFNSESNNNLFNNNLCELNTKAVKRNSLSVTNNLTNKSNNISSHVLRKCYGLNDNNSYDNSTNSNNASIISGNVENVFDDILKLENKVFLLSKENELIKKRVITLESNEKVQLDKINTSNAEVKEYEKEIRLKNQDILQLNQEIKTLSEELNEKSEVVVKMQKDSEYQNKLLEEFLIEIEELKKSKEEIQENAIKLLAEKEFKIQELKNQVGNDYKNDGTNKGNFSIHFENDNNNGESDNKLSERKTVYLDDIEYFDNKVNNNSLSELFENNIILKEEIKQLNSTIASKNREIEDLNIELTVKSDAREHLESCLKEAINNAEKYLSDNYTKEEIIKNLNADIIDKTRKINEKNCSISEINDKITKLNNEIDVLKQENSTLLNNQAIVLNNEITLLNNEITNLKNSINSMQLMLDCKSELLLEKDSIINRYDEKVNILENELKLAICKLEKIDKNNKLKKEKESNSEKEPKDVNLFSKNFAFRTNTESDYNDICGINTDSFKKFKNSSVNLNNYENDNDYFDKKENANTFRIEKSDLLQSEGKYSYLSEMNVAKHYLNTNNSKNINAENSNYENYVSYSKGKVNIDYQLDWVLGEEANINDYSTENNLSITDNKLSNNNNTNRSNTNFKRIIQLEKENLNLKNKLNAVNSRGLNNFRLKGEVELLKTENGKLKSELSNLNETYLIQLSDLKRRLEVYEVSNNSNRIKNLENFENKNNSLNNFKINKYKEDYEKNNDHLADNTNNTEEEINYNVDYNPRKSVFHRPTVITNIVNNFYNEEKKKSSESEFIIATNNVLKSKVVFYEKVLDNFIEIINSVVILIAT